MRLIVLVIIVVLRVTTASPQTQPQPQATPSPDAIAAAKELTAITSPGVVEEMTRGMVARMWPQLERSFGPQIDGATSALRPEVERSMQQFVIDGIQDFPLIYARYFTADELRQLAAFYKTPLGAMALSQLPRVMAEITCDLATAHAPFPAAAAGAVAGGPAEARHQVVRFVAGRGHQERGHGRLRRSPHGLRRTYQ